MGRVRLLKKRALKEIVEKIIKNNKNTCPKCHQSVREEGEYYRCTWNKCRHMFSKYKGTIFYKVKTKQWKVLKILELWLRKATNNIISLVADVNMKVVQQVLTKIKKAIPRYYESFESIGSNDIIVEIDESKFGKRKYNRGHHVEGVWVLGMVERSEKRRIKLVVVDNRSMELLSNQINRAVDSNSTIYTDCWRGYNGLSDDFNQHKTVNHSVEFVDKINNVHTNTIEGTWFAVKSTIPNRCRTKKLIGLYLLRFMIIRNSEDHPLIELINFL